MLVRLADFYLDVTDPAVAVSQLIRSYGATPRQNDAVPVHWDSLSESLWMPNGAPAE